MIDMYRAEVGDMNTKMMNKKEIETIMLSLFIQDEEVLFSKEQLASNFPACHCKVNHHSPTTYISFNLGKISHSP